MPALHEVDPAIVARIVADYDPSSPSSEIALRNLTQSITDLSPSVARELAKLDIPILILDRVKNLSTATARELANFQFTYLALSSLEALSPENGSILAKEGPEQIILDGLKSMPDAVASALLPAADRFIFEHYEPGQKTYLVEGMFGTHLRAPLARLLVARYNPTHLSVQILIPAATNLDPQAADELANLTNETITLRLESIRTLTPPICEALSKCRANLQLPNLESLTTEAARTLALADSAVDLGQSTQIEVEAIESLVQSNRSVTLPITQVTQAIGRALRSAKCDLHLPFLQRLTPVQSRLLSESSANSLWLSGLQSLSGAATSILHRFRGKARPYGQPLGYPTAAIQDLQPSIVAQLVAHDPSGWQLDLRGLRRLSPQTAEALSQIPHKQLRLDGVRTLSLASAKAIAKFKGDLFLSGLRSLTTGVCKALQPIATQLHIGNAPDNDTSSLEHLFGPRLTNAMAGLLEAMFRHRRDATSPTKITIPSRTHIPTKLIPAVARIGNPSITLEIESWTELTPNIAEALCKSPATLHLPNLRTLSIASAALLAKNNTSIDLAASTSIEPEALKNLTLSEGTITANFDALTTDFAIALKTARCKLRLPRLSEIPPQQARLLAESSAPTIELPGLEVLSPETAAALAGFAGKLGLPHLPQLAIGAAYLGIAHHLCFGTNPHDIAMAQALATVADSAYLYSPPSRKHRRAFGRTRPPASPFPTQTFET